MRQITTAIIDDQQACIDVLSKDLAKYPFINICGTATDSSEGAAMLLSVQPDLIFIDVEMPDRTGIEIIREVQPKLQQGVSIVFYSAYEKYMIDAIRVSAFDYLLKPYTEEELDALICRVREKGAIDPGVIWRSLTELLEDSRKIAINTISRTRITTIREIVYFSYDNSRRNWDIHFSDGSEAALKKSDTAEKILQTSSRLMKIREDLIVNLDYIASIENKTLRCNLVPPFGEVELYASRRAVKTLKDKVLFL